MTCAGLSGVGKIEPFFPMQERGQSPLQGSMDRNQRSMLARLITWLIVGIVVVLAARLLFAILRLSVGLAWWLLVTVVPLILIGWLAMKLWDRYGNRRPET